MIHDFFFLFKFSFFLLCEICQPFLRTLSTLQIPLDFFVQNITPQILQYVKLPGHVFYPRKEM